MSWGGNFSGGSAGGGGGGDAATLEGSDLAAVIAAAVAAADGTVDAATLEASDLATVLAAAFAAADGAVDAVDADTLDGQHGAYYLDPANLSAAVNYNKGGTAATSLGAARFNLGVDLGPIHGGRLCTSSSDPLDGTAGSTLYYTAWDGEYVSCFFGGGLALAGISASTDFEASTDLDLDSASIVADANYDVFVYYSGGAARLALKKWTNDSTRATALARTNGIYYLSGNTTYRYVGTVRTVDDSGVKFVHDPSTRQFLIWNLYNRQPFATCDAPSSPSSYATSAGAAQTLNGANYPEFKHEFVTGLGGLAYGASFRTVGSYSSGTPNEGYMALDGAEAAGSVAGRGYIQSGTNTEFSFAREEPVDAGYHYWEAYEDPNGVAYVAVAGYASMRSWGEW